MTTFTITCPPTVAGTTKLQSSTNSGVGTADFYGDSEYRNVVAGAKAALTSEQTFTNENLTIFRSESGSALSRMTLVDEFDDTENGRTEFYEETFSWDGARTINLTVNETGRLGDFVGDPEETITGSTWTAAVSTSSQTTTTDTEAVFQTTFTTETQVTTRTGTLVQTGTMTASEPSTTQTLVTATTSSQSNYTTTRLSTTTQQDNYSVWRSTDTGDSHRGKFQTATVVCLDTSELAWIVTARPNFTSTLGAIASFATDTQFTVLPSFEATAGVVIAKSATAATSSQQGETETTYTTTTPTATTLTVGTESLFNGSAAQLPVLTRTLATTTRTTQEYFSTIQESLYTGGDTGTTTRQTTTTHEGRIGNITWNATNTEFVTAQTAFEFSTSETRSGDFGAQFNDRFVENFENEQEDSNSPLATIEFSDIVTQSGAISETDGITFSRAISQVADQLSVVVTQNQVGSSLSGAFAAVSELGTPAQIVGAAGVTAKQPAYIFAARTARAPLGAWSYLDGTSSVAASADAAGLSVSTTAGPTSALTTESTSGAWTVQGVAVSRADVGAGMAINMGGVPATGDSLTALYAGGIFSTTDSAGSGIIEVSEASTALVESTNRTAYLPASGVFVTGGARYGTSKRNITDTIAETATITNRSQLVL